MPFRAFVLAALVCWPLGAVGGPTVDDRKKPAPVFAADVSLVSVPVFVVGRQGQAMRGLGLDDFELYDDKKRVPIVSFQYIDTTSPEAQEAIRQAPAARRRFLFLFDLSFTDPAGVMRAREAAREFVGRGLAASDLGAVATFDVNRGVRVVANFTEDRGLLLHAVDTLGVTQLARVDDPLSLAITPEATDLPFAGREMGEDANMSAVADAVLAVLARRLRAVEDSIYRSQVLGLLGSLEGLAKGLSVVEGRKQVIYFSAGFDSQALIGATGSDMRLASEALVWGDVQDVDSEARYGDMRLRGAFQDVTEVLSSADCVVHAVDVTGFGRDESVTRTEVVRDTARGASGITSGRESLNYLAVETGGRLFKDSNDLRVALSEISEMTSRYYILGYQPEDLERAGRFHTLKVKVRRKGARVSHRAGFHERPAPAAQTPLQRKFEAAQLVMTGLGARGLRLSALCLPFPAKGERQTLGLVLQVPLADLPSGGSLSLEVYGYAVAEDGTVRDHLAQLARLDPSRIERGGGVEGISFFGTLKVPPGRYTLKLMVQDAATGASGVQFIDVAVPEHDPRSSFLLPPVVMDDADRWLLIDMSNAAADGGGFPFTAGGRPFIPRTSFRVRGGVRETLALIAYQAERPGDPAAGLEIRSSLVDGSGTPVPPGMLRIERVYRDPGGRRTYLFAYTPEVLAAGDYTLRIGIGEANTRIESYSLLRVSKASAP